MGLAVMLSNSGHQVRVRDKLCSSHALFSERLVNRAIVLKVSLYYPQEAEEAQLLLYDDCNHRNAAKVESCQHLVISGSGNQHQDISTNKQI